MSDTRSKVLAVIPVRIGSKRTPRKPLKEIAGLTVLERAWRQVNRADSLSRVVIATDSREIEDTARAFGAEVLMTSEELTTGTARVAAAWQMLKEDEEWDIVVNIQGDMPFIHQDIIDGAVGLLQSGRSRTQSGSTKFSITTAAAAIFEEKIFHSPSVVKVVFGSNGEAFYFSRAAIPFSRDGERLKDIDSDRDILGFRHIGVYVFLPEILEFYLNAPNSMLEIVEMLEQLRVLEAGYRIGVFRAESEQAKYLVDIDTPEDLEMAEKICGLFDNCAE